MADYTYLFQTDTARISTDLAAVKSFSGVSTAHTDYVTSISPSTDGQLIYKPLGHTALNADTVWLFAITIIAGLIIGIVRSRATLFFQQMLTLTYSGFHWRSVTESMTLQNYWPSRLLHTAFYILTAVIIYDIYIATGHTSVDDLSGIKLYGAILGATCLFYIFKFALHSIIGFTFDIPEVSKYIITCKIIATDIFAIVALPIALIFPFVRESDYFIMGAIACTAFVLLYFWKILKSVKIILSDYLSFLYSILYLCTVEAIPVVCIYKLLTMM